MSEDAARLSTLIAAATGTAPEPWPGGITGFGRYRYQYASGRAGEAARVGFAVRKAGLTLYLASEAPLPAEPLTRLGAHTTGKGCVYLKRLDDADADALRDLIAAAWTDSLARYPA